MRLLDQEVKSDWRFKRRSPEIKNVLDELKKWDTGFGYFGPITIPSEVHVELIKTKLIPDPYVGFNEHKVQCKRCILWIVNTDSLSLYVRDWRA